MLIEALAQIGVTIDFDDFCTRMVGRSFPTVAADLRARGAAMPDTFEATYRARLLARFERELTVTEGVHEMLAALDRRVCVATSSSPARVRRSLELTGLESVFGADVFTASLVARGKPAPDLFLLAAERMGTPPHRCLVVEDSLPGLEAAEAAGMRALRYTGGAHLRGSPPQARAGPAHLRALGGFSRPAGGRMNGRDANRLDEAARAGWLYYVAGNTQDEIARKLGVSRQSAQRLVATAVSERLVRVRLDHPIARCMDLARAVSDRFALPRCEVVPSDPASPSLLTGVAIAAASQIERLLKSSEPRILSIGTGRTLRAMVAQLPVMDCPQHRIVSRLGNVMRDGSATPYNVVVRMAERVGARHYPMPLPVLAASPEERAALHALEPVRETLDLCARADATFVGIGQLGADAPLLQDGFLTREAMESLTEAGIVGEITSLVYDGLGHVLTTGTNALVLSAPLAPAGDRPVIGLAAGPAKVAAVRAALRGRLVNGLITDEATAELLLR